MPIGIPFLVRLNHNGTYSCKAASSRGTHTITVVMNVLGEPRWGRGYRRASPGGGVGRQSVCIYFLLLCIDRNARAVSIVLGMSAVLGVVTICAALLYVFRVHRHGGIYHVNQGSTSFPLTSRQPEESVGEDPS